MPGVLPSLIIVVRVVLWEINSRSWVNGDPANGCAATWETTAARGEPGKSNQCSHWIIKHLWKASLEIIWANCRHQARLSPALQRWLEGPALSASVSVHVERVTPLWGSGIPVWQSIWKSTDSKHCLSLKDVQDYSKLLVVKDKNSVFPGLSIRLVIWINVPGTRMLNLLQY